MFRRKSFIWPVLLIFTILVAFQNIQQITYLSSEKHIQECGTCSEVPSTAGIIAETLVSKTLSDFRFKLTYMPAAEYRGPIVEGWPPSVNRTISRYISNTNYITGFSSCMKLKDVRLLIIVKSAAQNLEKRHANRLTWVKFTRNYPQILVLYVVANPIKEDEQITLDFEMVKFCDILKVNIVDHYMNNTLKMASVLKFLYEEGSKVNPHFVLVMDDDSFVNIPLLWSILFNYKLITRNNFEIWGHVFSGNNVLRPEPHRHSQENFIKPSVCPMYMFNRNKYPDFLSGGGFILPFSTIPCMYIEAMRLPFFHIDDVFITGMVAERCAFPRRRISGFHSGRVNIEQVKETDILIHYVDDKLKKDLFQYFQSVPVPNVTNLEV